MLIKWILAAILLCAWAEMRANYPPADTLKPQKPARPTSTTPT